MVARFIVELKHGLSDLRLERYRNGGDDLDMLSNYFWNMALAEALLCPLGTVEALLRNTIHNTLSNHYGMSNWYDGRGFLEPKQQTQVREAKQYIHDRNKLVTPDRVVSQLTFGFWVTLLSRNYNNRFWREDRAKNLRLAFPHVPKRSFQRGQVQAKYIVANKLRNLAFHHEPLMDLQSLLNDYDQLYEGIAWIDPTMVVKTKLMVVTGPKIRSGSTLVSSAESSTCQQIGQESKFGSPNCNYGSDM